MKDNISKDEILKRVNLWVSCNLSNFDFRPYQLEYIVDIIYSILTNNHLNLIEAPTGSGKSIMVIIIAGVLSRYYDKKSYILCSDLYLWDQYSKAIDKYKLKNFGRIKGIQYNYTCDETGEDLMVSPCRLAMVSFNNLANKDWCYENKWECGIYCNYVRERFRAIYADVTLITYQLWFNYMKNSLNNNDCPFGPRDIIFCDECHKVPELCQEFRQIDINLHDDINKVSELLTFCQEINLSFDGVELLRNFDISKFLQTMQEKIEVIYNTPKEKQMELYLAILEYQKLLKDKPELCFKGLQLLYEKTANGNKKVKGRLSKREYKIYDIGKWVDSMCYSISEYIDMIMDQMNYQNDIIKTNDAIPGIKYIVKTDNKIYSPEQNKMVWPDKPIASYKFAKEDILVYKTLLLYQPYTVMFSATIGSKQSFDDNIGTKYINDKQSKMFVIPSIFDFSNSPIYYIPGNRMSRDFIEKSFNANASIINQILQSPKHINEKGIIHTGSYKNAWDLKEKLDPIVQKRIFIYNNSKEKKDILEQYAESDNGVLIGPTLTEGIDLPNDGCRFIIIFKIPYPYLGDELVKAKSALFPKWYNATTANSIIQGIGRGNRTPNDWSTTYILDGSFTKLYEDTREQYTPEFKNRLQLLTNNKPQN